MGLGEWPNWGDVLSVLGWGHCALGFPRPRTARQLEGAAAWNSLLSLRLSSHREMAAEERR